MALNLDVVGSTFEPTRRSWGSKDCLLYALGVGAGSIAPDHELEFTTEHSIGRPQRVLPTFAAVLGGGSAPRRHLGAFDPAMLLHGEQGIELFGSIPPEGAVRTTATVTGLYDKGSGAVLVTESTSVDAVTGAARWRATNTLFIRGEGGFGGDRGPTTAPPESPEGPPDRVVTYATRRDQALVYRLSGDRNPLHSDPEFARRAGFDRPILHGLCTYGFTGRALLHELCGSDPGRFVSMHGRFSRPTYPGETLTVSVWLDGTAARFRTDTGPGHTVLDQGTFAFRAAEA